MVFPNTYHSSFNGTDSLDQLTEYPEVCVCVVCVCVNVNARARVRTQHILSLSLLHARAYARAHTPEPHDQSYKALGIERRTEIAAWYLNPQPQPQPHLYP